MNFFSSQSDASKKQEKHDEDQDLTTLLSPQQRGELTLLIANATDCMRKAILDTFDPSQINADIRSHEEASKKKNPNLEKAPSSDAKKSEEDENLQKAQEQREKDLSVPKIQELKTAALKNLDTWRDSVLQRVGEVVNSRETAEKQKTQAHPSTSSSADMKALGSSAVEAGSVDHTLLKLYAPLPTSLDALPKDRKMLILHSTLLLLLSLEHYTAYSRVLLLYLTSSLHLPLKMLADDESKIAKGLLEAAKHMSGEAETQQRSKENETARRWKVGLASVAGAALIGVTGGLAAPLLAAGVGGVMGGLGLGATAAAGYLGTLAGSGVIVGSLFGAYGGRMTGQMMDQYAREVEDFAFLPVRAKPQKPTSKADEANPEDRRLRVAIGISGWLNAKEDVLEPWHVLGGHSTEPFALRFELTALLGLGNALINMVSSAAWGLAKKEIIAHTIFATLSAALWPLALLKISRVVDNPFSVAKARADKAGIVLADALCNKAQGERPVTLIGYSLGARVIYACLQSLADRKAFGLIESVVLIGAPIPSTASSWRTMRAVVAGRLVNVYSENDYILGFLYRTSSIQLGVAGLEKVDGVKGVQNVDVSSYVTGHLRYRYLVGRILSQIGFEDVEPDQVEREAQALRLIEEKERREEEARAQRDGPSSEAQGGASEETHDDASSDGHGPIVMDDMEAADEEAQKLETDVKMKQDQESMQRSAEKLGIRGPK
ncbi:MAG: hypothetical protein M1817_002592 [Caeruleum heppii]|nr:MAG: hypothetical protein M1817_002592 [Caeruleum heppii]